MLIIPFINLDKNLAIDAYSYSKDEIDIVAFVIKKSRIEIISERLSKDQKDRIGVRFFIKFFDIEKLEKTLALKFVGKQENTRIALSHISKGSSYKCSRIDTPPQDCVTFYSQNKKEAIVKCALIANSNTWLGGVPSPGSCENF